MGRSSGSGGGGGGHSGGFSGGGRVSGGFSGGGGRSGGRSGGGPSVGFGGGGGYRGDGHRGPSGGYGYPFGRFGAPFRRVNVGPIINVGGGRRRSAGGGCGGCLGTLIGILLCVLLIMAISGAMNSCSGGYSPGFIKTSYTVSSVSDTVRQKLDSGDVVKTGWYTDEDGDWIHDASRLERGLSHFFEKTGVQSYVYILKNGSVTDVDALNKRSAELYDELFADEGHFLLVFCDDGNGGYNCGYIIGTKARKVLDDEAMGVLKSALNNAYNNADTDEEVFSDAFYVTGEAIMKAAQKEADTKKAGEIGAVVACVLLAGGSAVFAVRRKKKADAERKARANEILNTPLEKFSDAADPTNDANIEDLASKYEKKDDSDNE